MSATDLVGFLLCEHLTTLSGRVAAGELVAPEQDDPELQVLRERGLDHEANYLAQLEAEGLSIVRVSDDDGPVPEQQQITLAALDGGADVVFQGAFWDDRDPRIVWRGHADFLRRVEGGYEPEDTKLARHVKPSAVLQLCNYAEQLGRLQGHDPEFVHVVLGGSERVPLRYREFASYYRLAKARFLDALAAGQLTEPYPVAHCNLCRWQATCERQWLALDRPWLVAGIGREQARKLAKAGITSVKGLAEGPETITIKGMSAGVYERARRQAGLQLTARALPADAPPPYELLEPADDVGLSVLPEPSPGDLFFDMEGDPFVGEHGIEYLFGVGWLDERGEFTYRSFWGHTPAEERAAFEQFVDFVQERRAVHPDLHVYHYAAYERTALGKLMGRYATREDEVDSLFRDKVLVDLYRVVRQSVAVGVPSYSIKKLEPLYMEARHGEINDGASSIVEYEKWLRTGDDKVLAAIEDYNLVDCESTWLLRDWLEARRAEAADAFGVEIARPRPPAAMPAVEDATETARLAGLLVPDPDSPDLDRNKWLLAQLLDWHRREAKPEWWQYFRRVLDATDDDFVADSESIGGLEFMQEMEPDAKSKVYRYAFDPEQEYKLAVGKKPLDPATERIRLEGGDPPARVGEIVALDGVTGTIDLRRAATSNAPHPRALIPGAPINTKVQQEALRRMATWVIEHGLDGAGSYRAARDLLVGRAPRVDGVTEGEPLRRDGESLLDAAIRCASDLRDSYLPVQGPPGSGKTWTATRVIVDLVRQGKRVGITANSHAVIGQLLCQVADEADRAGIDLRAMQKADEEDACGHPLVQRASNDEIEAACGAGEVDVVAGTAWLFTRERMFESLDYLVVDEAG
ncbi:MAG: TM0106 family RecB-like putative nuclease, partial [Actinobacteria bacterium]|nr:TM0106 family RecB-like putative nuclease [Actinomycetota bacterium]